MNQTHEMVKTTLPHLLRYRASTLTHHIAMREKIRGVWHTITWADYEESVMRFAYGLQSLGFKTGDRLCISSEDTPEWIFADIAVQGLGGISVGVYPTNSWVEVQYMVRHSESRFLICGDQEQTDKVIQACTDEGGLPLVEKIISVDMKGMLHYSDHRLTSFKKVCKISKDVSIETLRNWWQSSLQKINTDQISVIVYTSGTTGHPKGAQLTSHNLLHSADSLAKRWGINEHNYSVLCYLPLCHVGERICSITMHLRTGGVVNFAESIDTVQQNICEISPSLFLGMPRIWEKHRLNVIIKLKEARWYQQKLFNFVFERSYAKLAQHDKARPTSEGFLSKLENLIYRTLFFRSAIKHMGLDYSIVRICGGAAVSPETLRFFEVLGLPIYQVYGSTESGGITFAQHALSRVHGAAGQPIDGIEFKLDHDGEILIKGPNVFAGYLFDEKGTDEVLDKDGWLRTGDIGEMVEGGEIRIIDRKKAIIITSGGKNIAPSEIENALKESPYINEAIILGEARHFVGALIQIDPEVVGKWAQENGLAYTNYRSLAALPEVYKLVSAEVERVNGRFARVENVRKFVILNKELDHDDGELTATQKVKRSAIEKKFAAEIAQIYGDVSQ